MNHYRQLIKTSRWYVLIAICALVLAQGCDSDDTGADNNASADTTQSDSGDGDTSPEDLDGAGAGDTITDVDDGDTNASDTPGVDPDGDTTLECPLYQTLCDGTCIPTSTDPDNCGGCGVVCGDAEVCSGGTCTDTCMTGLDICERKCVDYDNDNDHCGACGNACGEGLGCVEGSCVQAADLGDRAEACVGGGPAIDLGDTVTVERQCSGELAERTFRWAVCSCEDMTTNSGLFADAYDSSMGPYVPGGEGGGIAANGYIRANSGLSTTGTLWASDDFGSGTAIQTNEAATIGMRLHAGSAVLMGAGTTIGGDAYIDGDVARNMTIGGDLNAPAAASIGAGVTYTNLQTGPVDVASPCDACGVDDRIPVGAIVADRSGTNNDNALIGLDEDLLSGDNGGIRRLDLPCGHYYLSEITTSGEIAIVANGNTALYIGGDIKPTAHITITLTPDAQLDIFVAGSVGAVNGMKLGSPNYPALLRMYVGGVDGFRANVGTEIAGFIYAVPGGIHTNSGVEVFGGVFGQMVSSNSGSSYHFDRRINMVGESCPDRTPDPDPDPNDDPDAGSDPDVSSDPDAGSDPDPDVCGLQTDSCEQSSDCCAPLVCGSGGECVLLECQPANGACSAHSDCCSGGCGAAGFCIVG